MLQNRCKEKPMASLISRITTHPGICGGRPSIATCASVSPISLIYWPQVRRGPRYWRITLISRMRILPRHWSMLLLPLPIALSRTNRRAVFGRCPIATCIGATENSVTWQSMSTISACKRHRIIPFGIGRKRRAPLSSQRTKISPRPEGRVSGLLCRSVAGCHRKPLLTTRLYMDRAGIVD